MSLIVWPQTGTTVTLSNGYVITSLGASIENDASPLVDEVRNLLKKGALVSENPDQSGNQNPSGRVPEPDGYGAINAKWYGAVGDGVNDDTVALEAWCAAANGKTGYLPSGTYIWRRGTPSWSGTAPNITANNTRIYGDGPSSLIVNDYSLTSGANEFYGAFFASGVTGLSIENLGFKQTTALLAQHCDDVKVTNCTIDGSQFNLAARPHFHDKQIALKESTNVKITGCHFKNINFGVHIGYEDHQGTVPIATAKVCRGVAVVGNTFENSLFTSDYVVLGAVQSFPVGVYVFTSQDCTISGNTFKNIYSQYRNGDPGTGLGFSV